jgi:predicted methyltransferase
MAHAIPPIFPHSEESIVHTLNRAHLTLIALALAGASGMAGAATTVKTDPQLTVMIASPDRTATFKARDAVRHPAEELTFFGLKSNMTVVELWPGSGYWSEILGPYLSASGKYYVAQPPPGDKEEDEGIAKWRARMAGHKDLVGKFTETTLGKDHFDIAPPNSADLVVTFRNLHNWVNSGYADAALAACFRALKPGGILGVEDHRGRTDKPQDPKAESGYLREDFAIALAKKAGFELVASSEINANPKDTKDWVDGVWTLPPTLSQGDKDRARYMAIGEADNFVLKFRKPAH